MTTTNQETDALRVALLGDDPTMPRALAPLAYLEAAVETAFLLLRGEREHIDADPDATWEGLMHAKATCEAIRAALAASPVPGASHAE